MGISKTAQGQSVEMARKILVVDDEPDICFVLEKTLGENGFMIDSYDDPLLALENFKPHSYSLVILDIRMPGLNGFALYREIKILDKKVKVCFLTTGEMYYGYSDIFSSLPGIYFIRKPIDNELLMKRINEIIADDEFEAIRSMHAVHSITTHICATTCYNVPCRIKEYL